MVEKLFHVLRAGVLFVGHFQTGHWSELVPVLAADSCCAEKRTGMFVRVHMRSSLWVPTVFGLRSAGSGRDRYAGDRVRAECLRQDVARARSIYAVPAASVCHGEGNSACLCVSLKRPALHARM